MARNPFDEITAGLHAFRKKRAGKVSLKKPPQEKVAPPELQTGEIIKLREKLNVSQAVFAQYLRINKRTLENWEQGRVKPNSQAVMLIKLVEKYPDTLTRLASL
ncbi:helix-turn-helix domain-containing protein [Cellvibrio sp. OA-2007]|uniref:helix-turn-helix domain-containing protein n=1 Tax=Cellvibrio sp. OA-2007 TaxID=529823 RepID=UPI0007848B40|nr:type II toxin-antitoxin system MqsA family antitoxin [Cellvibrio sp. OA-2007]